MSGQDIAEYLSSLVNRSENLQDLLRFYMKATASQSCAVFMHDEKTNEYLCLEHADARRDGATASFRPGRIVSSISTNVGFLTASYAIENALIIPISTQEGHLGVVCLMNRVGGYYEELVNDMSSYIAVTQFVISKHKLIQHYRTSGPTTSKDLFLANVSHEIRTPANGVIGYGQLLMQTELNATQRGYIQQQNQCCIQLMQIINDVLDFSKLSCGKMGVHTECFSLHEIVEVIQGTLGHRANEKKQQISFDVDDSVPEFLVFDKQKFTQILINLVGNAHKFTDIGGRIVTKFTVTSPNRLVVTVEDNGIGITEKDQCKLFSAFEQLNSSLCKTGTGLGLAICQKLVQLLGGDIFVKSTVGIGTVFTFTVKFQPFADYEKGMTRDAKMLKDKMVLVVDDNADNRILITETLFEWGMRPVTCASALEALRMILGNRYNFAIGLIDICMPGISGTELAAQIKEERPAFPLIALSSLDTFVTTQAFECRLDKPINKVQLFNAIHRTLSRKHVPNAYIGSDSDSSSSPSPTTQFNKEVKILVAEDVLYNRNLLENFLANLGYSNVTSVENGRIAVDMLEEAHSTGDPYKILLLDLRMPIMDGYQVIEAITERGWKLPTVIVISASVMDEDRTRCKSAGVKYFINKPIELHQFKDVLLSVTGRR
jgi:signal transduction histidine kinase/DNA-binding response OmpR family regulator